MLPVFVIAGWLAALLAFVAFVVGIAFLVNPDLQRYAADYMQKHLFPDPNQIKLRATQSSKSAGNVLRILAFGDSLTEGSTEGGQVFHPYAKRLGDLMYPQLPQDVYLEIEEQGESGARVLFGMRDRLQRTLDEHTAAGRLCDWVLLLAGINDLAGDQSSAEEVMSGLEELVRLCLQHGASVLLMTVMEVAQLEPAMEQQRQQLNTLIKEYVGNGMWAGSTAAAAAQGKCAGTTSRDAPQPAPADTCTPPQGGDRSGSKSLNSKRLCQGPGRVVLFDLASALPLKSMPEEQRHLLWDDGLHLTMEGYDHLGELLLGALLPLVREDVATRGQQFTEAA
eukprot:gene8080-8274_t